MKTLLQQLFTKILQGVLATTTLYNGLLVYGINATPGEMHFMLSALVVCDIIMSISRRLRWVRLLSMLTYVCVSILLSTLLWSLLGENAVHPSIMFIIIAFFCCATAILDSFNFFPAPENQEDEAKNTVYPMWPYVCGAIIISLLITWPFLEFFSNHQAAFTGEQCCFWIALPVATTFYINSLLLCITAPVDEPSDEEPGKETDKGNSDNGTPNKSAK